jgi:hypothetical protein
MRPASTRHDKISSAAGVARPVAVGLCALLLAATVAWAGKPVKGASYAALSRQGEPLSFKVSSSGKQVQGFSTFLGYNGACGQGGGPAYTVKAGTISIRSGRFSTTTTGKGPIASVKSIRVHIQGSFSGRSATVTVAELGIHCPRSSKNPYSETFAAKVH